MKVYGITWKEDGGIYARTFATEEERDQFLSLALRIKGAKLFDL